MIVDVIDLVIENVVCDMCELLVVDCSVYIVINFVVEDISSGCVLKMIFWYMVGSGILLQQIWMEVIECGFFDLDCVCIMFVVVCCVGYSVVIDDFGVGFFSL